MAHLDGIYLFCTVRDTECVQFDSTYLLVRHYLPSYLQWGLWPAGTSLKKIMVTICRKRINYVSECRDHIQRLVFPPEPGTLLGT